MVDASSAVRDFFSTILNNPAYLFLSVGGIALFMILLIARHIHKIHSEEIFVHQAWGSNWKGR